MKSRRTAEALQRILDLRRGSRAQRHRSAKAYRRRPKHRDRPEN